MIMPVDGIRAESLPGVARLSGAARRPGARHVAIAAMLACGLTIALVLHLGALGGLARRTPPAPSALAGAHATLASLPAPARVPVSDALGARQPAYRVGSLAGALRAVNARQGLTMAFTPSGVGVRSGATDLAMSLQAVGYGSALSPLGRVAPRARANRVLYQRPGLSEWYANGPLGLEQGFTLAHAPAGLARGPLTLAIALSGNARVTLGAGRRELLLSRGGKPVLRYGGLVVSDAAGRILPSWLELNAGRVLLRVDSARGVYPLRIDPVLQEAELATAVGEEGSRFGESVGISGNTIVVGAPEHVSGIGAAYVFTKPAGGWANLINPTSTLAPGEEHNEEFGKSVAISGNTVVVGEPYRTAAGKLHVGGAYVYVEPPSGWPTETDPTATLTASDGLEEDRFGSAVAISGETIVVGAPNHQLDGKERTTQLEQGAAYVFQMPAAGWASATQTAELTPSDGDAQYPDGGGGFGWAVAISARTIVVGAPLHAVVRGEACTSLEHCIGQGAAYVYVEPCSGWVSATQTAELTASDGRFGESSFQGDELGKAVAVSGGAVLLGAPGHQVSLYEQGAGYEYTMPSAGWANATQTAELTASAATEEAKLGSSVAIVGGSAVLGAYVQSSAEGALFRYLMPAGGWSNMTEGSELAIKEAASTDYLGISAAISEEALVAGAVGRKVGATAQAGAAYVFENSSSAGIAGPGGCPGKGTPAGGGSPGPSAGSSSGIASSPAAIEELLLGCSSRPVVLNDVYIHGSRVLLSGSAARRLIGRRVKILFNERNQVAVATVKANGQFETTAPLPPAKIRERLTTRYTAEIGTARSLHLKLTRRLLLEPPRVSGDRVTLSGRITLPLTKPVAAVTVEAQFECGRTRVLETFKPPANGRFDSVVSVPAGARAAIFRLKSLVAANAHSTRHGFTTFSLPLPVAVG